MKALWNVGDCVEIWEGYSYVYELVDPRTRRVRYVGATVDPKSRLRDYCGSRPGHSNKLLSDWLKDLKHQGFRPIMRILEVLEGSDTDIVEQRWIALYRSVGIDLLNLTTGGKRSFVINRLSVKQRDIRWESNIGSTKRKSSKSKKYPAKPAQLPRTSCKRGHPWVDGQAACKQCAKESSNAYAERSRARRLAKKAELAEN